MVRFCSVQAFLSPPRHEPNQKSSFKELARPGFKPVCPCRITVSLRQKLIKTGQPLTTKCEKFIIANKLLEILT